MNLSSRLCSLVSGFGSLFLFSWNLVFSFTESISKLINCNCSKACPIFCTRLSLMDIKSLLLLACSSCALNGFGKRRKFSIFLSVSSKLSSVLFAVKDDNFSLNASGPSTADRLLMKNYCSQRCLSIHSFIHSFIMDDHG